MPNSHPRVILLIGLPGSGKSTYAQEQKWPVLSSDFVRHLLLDDITDQTANRKIFRTLRSLLKTRLELARPLTVIDATNLTPAERRPYIMLAAMYGARPEAVYFDIPLEECKARNRRRHRVVPEDVLDRMANRLTPPVAAEGFTAITVVQLPVEE